MDAKTDESVGKCPVPHSRGRMNRDWWPNQLNIGVLHQNTPDADPMGKGFDYAKEFDSLDLDALATRALMTDRKHGGLRLALRSALHPHDVARRRHLPRWRWPRWWRTQ
jgi:hypothetical protein